MSGYYPAGAEWDPNAPYNEVEVPEKDFDITCCQTLSKTTVVTTNNYIPGASGCDYERDDEGGCCAVGWQDSDDTSDTSWSDEYKENGHYTPLQLIGMLKMRVEKELKDLENAPIDTKQPYAKAAEVRRLKHLIEECDDWCEDETDFEEG